MQRTIVCRRCRNSLASGTKRCPNCGSVVPSAAARLGKVAAIVVSLLLGGVLVWKLPALHLGRGNADQKKDKRIAAIIQPAMGRPAFEIAGVMNMRYRDLGSKVEIEIAAKSMPILYADVDKDGVISPQGTDLSYAAYPGGTVCVQRLGLEESTRCAAVPSSAKVQVRGGPGAWDLTWTIPKEGLSATGDTAEIAVQLFEEAEQRGTYYPGPPFGRVYQLQFSPTNPGEPSPSLQSTGNNKEKEGGASPPGTKVPKNGKALCDGG